jgi:hypothetical protein
MGRFDGIDGNEGRRGGLTLIFCTVDGSTPNRAAILRTPSVRPVVEQFADSNFVVSMPHFEDSAGGVRAIACAPRRPTLEIFSPWRSTPRRGQKKTHRRAQRVNGFGQWQCSAFRRYMNSACGI